MIGTGVTWLGGKFDGIRGADVNKAEVVNGSETKGIEPNRAEFVGSKGGPRLPVKLEMRGVVIGIASEGLSESMTRVGNRTDVLVARKEELLLKSSMVPLSVGSGEASGLGREVTFPIVLPFDGNRVLFGRSVGRIGLEVVFGIVTFGESVC